VLPSAPTALSEPYLIVKPGATSHDRRPVDALGVAGVREAKDDRAPDPSARRSEELLDGRIDRRDHLFVGPAHPLPIVPQAAAPPANVPKIRWASAYLNGYLAPCLADLPTSASLVTMRPAGPCSATQRPDARC
jgi:hypothetical protein